MRLTKKGKRRLLILLGVIGAASLAIGLLFAFRGVYQGRLAEKARAQGLAAYEAGDYETAIFELQYPRDHNPQDLEVLLAIAHCHSKVADATRQHLPKAVSLYNQVLRLEPDNLLALEKLLVLYGRMGYQAEAMTVVDRLLLLDENHIDALSSKYALTFSHDGSDNSEVESVLYARRLIALQPDQINWYKFLLESMRRDKTSEQEMLDLCDTWIKAYEGDGRFYLLKAEFLLVLSRFSESRILALEAARHGADSLKILDLTLSMFDVLNLQKSNSADLETARADLLTRTIEKFPSESWVYEAIIRQHWRVSRIEQALAVLESARSAVNPIPEQLVRWEALLYTASDRRDEAQTALGNLLALAERSDPEQRDVSRAWAEALQSRLDVTDLGWPKVIESLLIAINLAERDPVLFFLLGEAYQRIQEHELAARTFQDAIRYEPFWLKPYVSRGRSLLVLGRAEEAMVMLTKIIRRMPSSGIEPYVLLAEAWLATGRAVREVGLVDATTGQPIDLLTMLRRLNEHTSRNPQLTRLLILAYAEVGDEDSIGQIMDEAMDDHEATSALFLVLAEQSERLGMGQQQKLLERAETIEGLTANIVAAKAASLHRAGRTREALAVIEQIVHEPVPVGEDSTLLLRLKVQIMGKDDSAGAAVVMRRVLDLQRDSHEAAMFVLSNASAWHDQELIKAAITQLQRTVGNYSPRVIIANASYVMRFESDDSAQLASALGKLSQVIRHTPDSLPALTLMSELLLVGDVPDPQRAAEFLSRAVDHYPRLPNLYPRLISMYQQMGRYNLAEQYLVRLGELNAERDGTDPFRLIEMNLLQSQGDFETLLLRLRETVDDDSNVQDQLNLAFMYRRTGRDSEAGAIYQRLVETETPDEQVVSALAGFLASIGQFEEALRMMEAYDLEEGEVTKLLMIARLCSDYGRLELAGVSLLKAFEIQPENPPVVSQYARHLIARGEFDRARDIASQALLLDAENEELLITRAVADLNRGLEGRTEALKTIAALGESHAGWYATESLNDRRLRSSDPTTPSNRDLAGARALVRDYPQYLPGWRLAVTMHIGAKLGDEATVLAREAARTMPDSAEAVQWLVSLLIQQDKREEALESAYELRKRMPTQRIVSDVMIAALLMDLGRSDEALSTLLVHQSLIESQFDQRPDWVAVWLRVLNQEREFDRALTLLASCSSCRAKWYAFSGELAPDDTRRALQLVAAYAESDAQEAFTLAGYFLVLARRSPQHALEDALKAEQLVEIAELDEAMRANTPVLWASIATLRGEYEVAEAHYRRILNQQPNNIGVLNNLAFSLLRRDPHSAEALILVTRAVQIDSNNADLLDTYAQALSGAGKFEEAGNVSIAAIDRKGDDPALRLTLVRIRIEQRRYDDALAQIVQARRLINVQAVGDETLSAECERLEKRIEVARTVATP